MVVSPSSLLATDSSNGSGNNKTHQEHVHVPVDHTEQASLIELAQRKFHETKEEMSSLKKHGSRFGHAHASTFSSRSLAGIDIGIDDKKKDGEDRDASQLLSTLLYLSVMMEKVDGIKQLLLQQNPAQYEEWRPLFDSLHSPSSTLHERLIHNDRVKQTYKRKQYYKDELEKAQIDHGKFKVETERAQQETKLSVEKLNATVSTLTDTLSKLEQRLLEKENECKSIVVDKQAEREKHKKEIDDAKEAYAGLQHKLESKEKELQNAREELKVAEEKHRQESLIASQSLDRAIKEGEEAKSRLEETRKELRGKDEDFVSSISALRDSITNIQKNQIEPIPLASIVSLLEEHNMCPCKARGAQNDLAVIVVETAVSVAKDAVISSQGNDQ